MEVPDFRNESIRKKYESDDWSPDPTRKKPGQPPSSILGEIEPSDGAKALAKKVWASRGYFGRVNRRPNPFAATCRGDSVSLPAYRQCRGDPCGRPHFGK